MPAKTRIMHFQISRTLRLASLLMMLGLGVSGCGENDFSGHIGKNIEDSEPDFLDEQKAPEKAPNIIVIVADDLGYADISPYGSEIDTPSLQQLADNGLRYNHFTVTAVCSSTRAALLTGLNHHSAGTGWLAEWDFGYPGYRGEMHRNALTLPEILKLNGYSTLMVGKWHLTNGEHRSPIGPFDSWPTSRGFEKYWGFLEGEASQFKPHWLVDGTTIKPPPASDDFYLPDALTDKAIEMIRTLRNHDSEKPFFLYYATGAPHAPHHTKKSDREKYLGQYHAGWDVIRQQRLEKQKALGLVPENTRLSPYTPGVEAWETLNPDQKKMYARLQENYAAFVDNLDQNVGRLLDYLEKSGQRENTLILFTSDNGGSREVSIEGSSNALRYYHYHPSTTRQNLVDFDRIGDIETHPHYPLGWMQTSNTPFIHSKRTAHDGGTRVPLIISWPAGISQRGIRPQFHHVNDIAPTLLALLKITPPETYQGMEVKPMEGISMAYSFAAAEIPGNKHNQYYEIEGRRAYYSDGWKIIAYREPDQKYDETSWELYHLDEDFSASENLAERYPDKVEALEKRWWQDAERYDVLPLIDIPLLERPMHTRIWLEDSRKHFEYTPDADTIHRFKGPVLPNHSYRISASIKRDNTAQEGVLVALGDYYSGYTLYIKNNRLHYESNVAHKVYKLTSGIEIPAGHNQLEYRFEKVNLALAIIEGLIREGTDFDRMSVLRGTGSLWVNGKKVAEQAIDQPVFAVWEGLDIGKDLLTPVSRNYISPFAFEGRLEKISYDLD